MDETPRTADRRTATHPIAPHPDHAPPLDGQRPTVPRADTAAGRPPPAWDGWVVTVMTAPERCASFHTQLATVVQKSHAGILVTAGTPWRWPGGPVVAVQLRRNHDGATGPALWLGPLSDPGERAALCQWLHGGPTAWTVPRALHRRILTRLRPPPAAAQTMN